MFHTTRYHSSFALLLCAIICPCPSLAHAQSSSWAKWMPHVGDIFIYDFRDTNSYPGSFTTIKRIDTCIITGVDVFLDSNHQHAVIVNSSHNYYFFLGDSTIPWNFVVESVEESLPVSNGHWIGGGDFELNFSSAYLTKVNWMFDSVDLLTTSQPSYASDYSASYAPTLRWFMRESMLT